MDRRSPINPSAVPAVLMGSYAMIIIDTSIVMTGLPHIRVEWAMESWGSIGFKSDRISICRLFAGDQGPRACSTHIAYSLGS